MTMFTGFKDHALKNVRLAELEEEQYVLEEERLNRRNRHIRTIIALIIATVLIVLACVAFSTTPRSNVYSNTGHEIGVVLDSDSGEIVSIFSGYGEEPELKKNEEIVYTTSPEWRSIDNNPNDDFYDVKATYSKTIIEVRRDVLMNGETRTAQFFVGLDVYDFKAVTKYYNQLVKDGEKYTISEKLSPFTVVFDDVYNKVQVAQQSELLPELTFEQNEPIVTTNSVIATLYASGMSATEALEGLGSNVDTDAPYGMTVSGEYDFSCAKTVFSVTNSEEFMTKLSQIAGVDTDTFNVRAISLPVFESTTTQPCGINTLYTEKLDEI